MYAPHCYYSNHTPWWLSPILVLFCGLPWAQAARVADRCHFKGETPKKVPIRLLEPLNGRVVM